MIDLTDTKVVVTGGSRGIGAECCRLFARAGARVLIVYRAAEEAAEALLCELREISGRPHARLQTDVAFPEQVDGLTAFVRAEWGGLDCLVNNAGVWERNPLAAFDLERYRRAIDVNVLGSFLCAAGLVDLLAAAPDGNIVNITSTAGQRGEAFHSPYAASKGAMISATKSWSSELAPRVRVNSVAPGWVDTEMNVAPFADGGREALGAAIPLGRVATAAEIAGPVLFLASPLARHITGEILNVNGGSVLVG